MSLLGDIVKIVMNWLKLRPKQGPKVVPLPRPKR